MPLLSDTTQCMEKDFIIRPIVSCLPAWFRFAQCLRRYRDSKEAFPHLVNAGKYSATFFVVVFATMRAYHSSKCGTRSVHRITSNLYQLPGEYENTLDNPYTILWFISSLVSSCYAYTWDIKMDWGLFDKNANEAFLREEMVYSASVSHTSLPKTTSNAYHSKSVRTSPTLQWFYYFAIVEDFVLRFLWILSFALTELKYVAGDSIVSIAAPLEVFRRFVWNFFRLENEHLNNCGEFRAVRDISIAPIDSSDQALILRMMDDDEGVVNRYDRHNRPKVRKQKDPERKALLTPQLAQSLRRSLQDIALVGGAAAAAAATGAGAADDGQMGGTKKL